MRPRASKDDGAVLVMVAMLLVVLFAFGVLAVDVGYWYSVERQLQSAADASALAGCQALIRGADEGLIWTEVNSYIDKNETGLLDPDTAVLDMNKSDVDVEEGIVKVTLRTTASSVLSRVIGKDSADLAAQAVARVGYLAGVRFPVPWGMPINRAKKVTVQVGGGAEVALTELDENNDGIGDGVWRGSIPSGSTGSVNVRAYNEQTSTANPNGIPTELLGVAQIESLPPASKFKAIWLSPSQVFTAPPSAGAGQSITFSVDVSGTPIPASQSVELNVAGTKYQMDANADRTAFSKTVAAPYTDNTYAPFTATVGIKNVEPDHTVRFVVRRATFPIQNVSLTQCVFPTGTTPNSVVTVTMHEYQPGELYTLKVVGGAGSVGNFMALDFMLVHHYTKASYKPQNQDVEFPWLASNDSYLPMIAGTFDDPRLVLHLRDVVWTAQGTGPYPQISDRLATRFGGEVSDYDWWVAQDPRPNSKRVIAVPVVELLETEGGRTAVRIVTFASFYVTKYERVDNDTTIWGRFVEYTQPGVVVVDDPPGPLNIRTAHLVGAPYLKF